MPAQKWRIPGYQNAPIFGPQTEEDRGKYIFSLILLQKMLIFKSEIGRVDIEFFFVFNKICFYYTKY